MQKQIYFIIVLLLCLAAMDVYASDIADLTGKNHSSLFTEQQQEDHSDAPHIEQPDHTEATHGDESHLPSPFMVIPFVLLLLMIATGPLFYHHFWEKHYPKIAFILGAITASYYLFVLGDEHNMHELMHGITEYIAFIALLGSLFIASGGILIKVDRKATPMLNVLFLAFGAVIANVIGTTGASMLLIRPFIKMNRAWIKPYHIIFFIFLVSNIGGALTPIGDPPLFLGFLSGVPFFWVIGNVIHIWIPTIIVLLIMFYFVDSRTARTDTEGTAEYTGEISFKGLKNIVYLVIILISVFLDPKVLEWVPDLAPLPFEVREVVMFAVMILSYKTADKEVLRANEFDFEPIKEVAYLFIGIFMTMIPALQLIAHIAKSNSEMLSNTLFFWATGVLSSFLDNAPTYLNFLAAALGKFSLSISSTADVREFVELNVYLKAISVAAVYFGAMTYIGNGPNFMVKSISERAGIKMPSFFAYMVKYSIPILIPVFILVWLAFFNN